MEYSNEQLQCKVSTAFIAVLNTSDYKHNLGGGKV